MLPRGGEAAMSRDELRSVRKRAKAGEAAAQNVLGAYYHPGHPLAIAGVPQDFAESKRLYGLSAAQGDATGQASLAFLHHLGNGMPVNEGEAMRLFSLAAAQGHDIAQYQLGRAHFLRQHFGEATRFLRLSADQGNPGGQCQLGICYFGCARTASPRVPCPTFD
jgi:TPR repeat protein